MVLVCLWVWMQVPVLVVGVAPAVLAGLAVAVLLILVVGVAPAVLAERAAEKSADRSRRESVRRLCYPGESRREKMMTRPLSCCSLPMQARARAGQGRQERRMWR
jgi:hypothetical protein